MCKLLKLTLLVIFCMSLTIMSAQTVLNEVSRSYSENQSNPGFSNIGQRTDQIFIQPNHFTKRNDYFPPRNVQVEVNEESTLANVSWLWPFIPPPQAFNISHGSGNNTTGALGADHGGAISYQAIHRFDTNQLMTLGVSGGQLLTISFWPNNGPFGTGTGTFTIKVYTGGSENPLNPGNEIYSQPVNSSEVIWNEWTEVILHQPIDIPTNQELWIGYHVSGTGNIGALGNAPAIDNYGNVVHWNQEWLTLPDYFGNFLIKAMVVGATDGKIQSLTNRSEKGRDNPRSEGGRHTPLSEGSNLTPLSEGGRGEFPAKNALMNPTFSMRSPTPSLPSLLRNDNKNYTINTQRQLSKELTTNRAFEGFNVYRLMKGDENNESSWTLITENAYELTSLDTHWSFLPMGTYVYAVKSSYTGNHSSEAGFSNDIIKNFNPIFSPPKDFAGVNMFGTFDVILTWKIPDYEEYTGAPISYQLQRDGETIGTTTNLTYTDTVPESNIETNYVYSLKAIYISGESEYVITDVLVGIVSDDDKNISFVTALIGNYPNPFNPSTFIAFEKKDKGHIQIDIFNIRGQKVRALLDDVLDEGVYNIEWNGNDEHGRSVGSGVFFYQMKTSEYSAIKKMVLMK